MPGILVFGQYKMGTNKMYNNDELICKMLMNFYLYAEILKPHLNINQWLKQIALCI